MMFFEKHCCENSREKGYTLLEMAIALVVLGVITAGLFQAYSIYLRQQQIRTTNDNITLAINELERFKDLYGYYPCPASLTAGRDAATYGKATDCSINTLPLGATPAAQAEGTDGVTVVTSGRTVTDKNGVTYTPRVRVGALPFRDINIAEKSSYDGYGSRLVYALTERSASLETYSDLEGGIGILGSDTDSMVNPPDSAIFALLSPGRNKSGGVDTNGNYLAPCDTASPEGQNCDLGTNAVFRSVLESNAAGNQYDDRISFFTPAANALWVRTSSDDRNIIDTTPGNVGIGTLNPVAKLDIKDSSATVDPNGIAKPEGTLRASGKIKTDLVCPNGTVGSTDNCFKPGNIAGDNTTNPANNTPGDGMKCPAGQYMNGIQDGRAICSAVAVRCDGNLDMMTGINPTTGAPICTTIPCRTQNVTICSTSRTLASGAFNTSQTITGGSSRSQTYRCQANAANTSVSWVNTANSGSCSCTPSSTTTTTSCGAGYNGSYTTTTTCVCPSGTCTSTNNRAAMCNAATCVAQAPQVTSADCPEGYTGGPRVTTRTWRCSPSPGWTSTTTGVCTCAPKVPNTRVVDVSECDTGYSGTGTKQPQRWDLASCSWVNDGPAVTSCSCNPTETQTFQEDPACEPSEHVTKQATIVQTRDGANCTWNTKRTVEAGTCAPNTYRWKSVGGSGNTASGKVGPLVNESCTYNDYLNSSTARTCSQNVSGSTYLIMECLCQP